MINPDLLVPLMFVVLFVFMVSGFPVAFALAANGLLFGYIAIEQGLMNATLLQAIPERIFGIMSNDTLLAIPFFTFMGLILEKSGMAEDLLETAGHLFGKVRGGLAYAVVIVGALLAATTGVIAASVISMGLISLPVMLKHGYSPRLASGVIAASGTLAQIIPPSLVLIVMADQLGVSVGDMYAGAMLPSVTLVGLYLAYIFVLARVNRNALPPLNTTDQRSHWQMATSVLFVLVPPLMLIFLVLGTIFLGIATPTEGGAMGAVGALALAGLKGRLSLNVLKQALDATTKLSSFVLFILIGSTVFSLTFRAIGGDLWVEQIMTHLPGGQLGFLVAVQLLIFILGCFLDFFEIAFIAIPLLAPVAQKLGIDPVWFGVMIGVNLQTSFLTPPFGFALFYLKSVTPPEVKTSDIYKGILPFILIQVTLVVLIYLFPQFIQGQKKQIYKDTPLQLNLQPNGYSDPYSDPSQNTDSPFRPSFSQPTR